MKIRITKSEFDLIEDLLGNKQFYFIAKSINSSEMILVFHDTDKSLKFDELIKDKLVYQGFDIDYNLNPFGQMCENVIDKMYEILN